MLDGDTQLEPWLAELNLQKFSGSPVTCKCKYRRLFAIPLSSVVGSNACLTSPYVIRLNPKLIGILPDHTLIWHGAPGKLTHLEAMEAGSTPGPEVCCLSLPSAMPQL